MANTNFKKLYGFLCLLSLGTSSLALPATTHTTLEECLDVAGVEGITAAESAWSSTISPFNLRTPFVPAAVALPTTPQQVSAAVKCAKTYGKKVQARGGGHSYSALGLGGANGALVVDMNRFNAIELNQTTKVVKVGSGVRLGNLATAIIDQGRALPHGVCPGVGIGGHASHGGFGFTSRMWGIALDRISKLELVLADGTITYATPTYNKDLFWAMRGAGSSFGITTFFHLDTLPVPKDATQFTVTLPTSDYATVQQKVNLFMKMQDYGQIAPKEIALRLFMNVLYNQFEISGVYWGSKSAYDTAIASFVAALPSGATFTTTERDFAGTLRAIAWVDSLQVPLTGYNEHDTFFAKSLVTTEPQTEQQLTNFFNFLATEGTATDVPFWVLADLYGGQHSKIAEYPLSSSSYAHRDSFFTWQLYANVATGVNFPSTGIPFMNDLVDSMTEYMDPDQVKAYVNYADPTLSAAEAHKLYYGNEPWNGQPGAEGISDKLTRLKSQFDPTNLFWNPQTFTA